MIKAVIFDLDNTLYDYDYCNNIAIKRVKDYAISRYCISGDLFDEAFASARRNVKKSLAETGASHNRMLYMQLFLENIGHRPLDGALDLYNLYWDSMLQNMKLFNYVLPTFELLKKNNIKIGILTDLTANIQHRKLFILGLSDFVDYLVTSEEAGVEKPDEEIFKLIISKAGVDPCDILMVGDDCKKDIECAIRLGMETLYFEPNLADAAYDIIKNKVGI